MGHTSILPTTTTRVLAASGSQWWRRKKERQINPTQKARRQTAVVSPAITSKQLLPRGAPAQHACPGNQQLPAWHARKARAAREKKPPKRHCPQRNRIYPDRITMAAAIYVQSHLGSHLFCRTKPHKAFLSFLLSLLSPVVPVSQLPYAMNAPPSPSTACPLARKTDTMFDGPAAPLLTDLPSPWVCDPPLLPPLLSITTTTTTLSRII